MKHFLSSLVMSACMAACATRGFAQEAVGDKVSLFDGKTLAGWTTGSGKPMEQGWVIEDGCLHRKSRGGDIFSAKAYTNFIFELEWKISPKGNSGIKYRYTTYGKSSNGPEYQILDDAGHPDGSKGAGKRRSACLYDIMVADTAEVYKEAGQWNTAKIVARGHKVEHWLNDKLVLSYDSSTDAFREAVQQSKFKANADYASKLTGRIMLQDHGNLVWYRNIAITELAAGE